MILKRCGGFCLRFIGTIRLQVFEHYIIEAHPDDTIPDLRLDRPLKSFVDYCEDMNWECLTRDEHFHLPSLVILFRALQLWQKQFDRTDLPQTRVEKDKFREIIDQLSEHSAYEITDVQKSLENFEEAKRTIPSRLVKTTLPMTIKQLFQDPSCIELNKQSHLFWFIIHSMKLFTENEGRGLLPVRGEVPDMITKTNSYVQLLEIYQKQAKKDCDIVHNYLLDLLTTYNRSSDISYEHLVQIYCKNAAFLNVLRTSAMKDEKNLFDRTDLDLSWYEFFLHLGIDLFALI